MNTGTTEKQAISSHAISELTGELACMGVEGDTKIVWTRTNADEVANARRTFDDLRRKGFLAFSANKKGDQGEQIDTFDPNAERIIMVPQMQGG